MVYVGTTLIIQHATHAVVDDGVESAVAPEQRAQPFVGIFARKLYRVGGLVGVFAQVFGV